MENLATLAEQIKWELIAIPNISLIPSTQSLESQIKLDWSRIYYCYDDDMLYVFSREEGGIIEHQYPATIPFDDLLYDIRETINEETL